MIRKSYCSRNEDYINRPPENKKIKLDNLETIIHAPVNNVTDPRKSSIITTDTVIFKNDKEKLNDYQVEYLEMPAKLDIDDRLYRVIRLKNGLTAFLISDGDDNVDKENKKESCESSSGDDGVDKTLIKNFLENEKFEEENVAFCSLCINVGNFSDPFHIQGLAHLLEHMLSMGSKKYPQENGYDEFIQKRWGSCNAYTESEKTTYSFDIPEKYLLGAIDRFAHLFIDPLITKNSITRERHALENEFKMAEQLDASRKLQLKHSFARENHPALKFSWGNLRTLKENISIEELHSELHKFRERHYSAHRMTLTVQASAPLDKLEMYVKDCFSEVPVNYLPPDDFSTFIETNSFDSLKFKKIYHVKTVKDISEVELNWIMPAMHDLYKSKPWEYVYWLLSRTDEGSLFHYLRKKMWCLDIYNGCDESFEHSSMYYLFSLTLVLSDEGYKHLNEILDLVFSYVNLLRQEGVQKTLFDHIKQIRDKEYKSSFDYECDRFAEKMSQNMQYYPPVHYLNGYDLIFEYDPKSIQHFIEAMCPENVNVIISGKNFNDKELDKVEPWFHTKYSSSEIPKERITCWKQIKPLPVFNLSVKPSQTSYTAETDSLFYESAYPIKIHHDNSLELWYIKLSESCASEFSIYLHLINPHLSESPLHAAMMNLLAMVLIQITNEYLTKKSRIFLSIKGILIQIYGYDKTLSLRIVQKVLEDLAKCYQSLSEDLFNLAKRETLKVFYNNFIDPGKLNLEVWLSIISSIYWMSIEKYNALVDITYSQFINYMKTYSKQFFVQCLIKGCMANDEVIKCVYESLRPLQQRPLLSKNYPPMRAYEFNRGEKCCQIKNLNFSDVNTVVTNYYQIGVANVRLLVMFELLSMIMEEPLFHRLRTQEQLGYKINCRQHYSHGIICLAINVVTQANNFTGEYIDERIQQFIESFRQTLINIPEEEFECIKQSYVKLKYRLQFEESDDMEDNWTEILSKEYMFNRSDEEIEIMKHITVNDMFICVNQYLIVGANYRKLSVQIVGTSDTSDADYDYKNTETEKYSLRFSTEIKDEKKKNSGYYINDIRAYKGQLNVYS